MLLLPTLLSLFVLSSSLPIDYSTPPPSTPNPSDVERETMLRDVYANFTYDEYFEYAEVQEKGVASMRAMQAAILKNIDEDTAEAKESLQKRIDDLIETKKENDIMKKMQAKFEKGNQKRGEKLQKLAAKKEELQKADNTTETEEAIEKIDAEIEGVIEEMTKAMRGITHKMEKITMKQAMRRQQTEMEVQLLMMKGEERREERDDQMRKDMRVAAKKAGQRMKAFRAEMDAKMAGKEGEEAEEWREIVWKRDEKKRKEASKMMEEFMEKNAKKAEQQAEELRALEEKYEELAKEVDE